MEKLVEIIANELSKYEKNNQIVDQGFIKKIIEVFVRYYNIGDFVQKCEFNKGLGGQKLSGYNVKEKKIYVGYNDEIMQGKLQIVRNGLNLNPEASTMFINYRLIGAIIHELTHALQYFKCMNNHQDLETFLLNYGLDKNIILLENNERTDNLPDGLVDYLLYLNEIENDDLYYLTVPNERMANITGNTYEEEISKHFKKEKYDTLNDTIQLKNLTHRILNYDRLIPSVLIINTIEAARKEYGLPSKFDSYESIVYYLNEQAVKKQLSLNDRLLYGMPIAIPEYELLENKRKSLERKIMSH